MEEKKKCPFCGKNISTINILFQLIGWFIVLEIGLYLMHIGGIF